MRVLEFREHVAEGFIGSFGGVFEDGGGFRSDFVVHGIDLPFCHEPAHRVARRHRSGAGASSPPDLMGVCVLLAASGEAPIPKGHRTCTDTSAIGASVWLLPSSKTTARDFQI